MAESSSSSGGIGLLGTVFIVFLVLKLLGYITWSWLWVTAPLWMPLAILFGVLLIWVLCSALFGGGKESKW